MLPLIALVLTAAGAQEAPISPALHVISGKAGFSDGHPLADARLEFRQQSEPSSSASPSSFYCQTDSSGNFRLEVAQSKLGFEVIAEKWSDGDRLRWRCTYPHSAGEGNSPVKLEFENRGRIVVRVFGLTKLPSDYQVFLRCSTPGSLDSVSIHRQLEAGQYGVEIHGLEPRDYQISVNMPRIGMQDWTTSVNVPATAPYRAVAKIQLPDLQFGSLRATVTLPDGKTPASQLSLWIEAQGGDAAGKWFMTDEAGMLHAQSLPAGPVRVRCINSESFAPTAFFAEIESQATVDMGKVRLQAMSEVYSWLTGSLLYRDGSPIPQVSCSGWQAGLTDLNGTTMDLLGVYSEFRADGSYRVRFPAGKHWLKFEIEGTGMQFQGGAFQLFAPITKCILVDADSDPGQTLQRDIVLNKQSNPATSQDLQIEWSGKGEPRSILLYTEQAPGVLWATQVTATAQQTSVRIADVPHGDCLVLLREMSSQSFQGKLISEETLSASPRHAVHFTSEELGSLNVTLSSDTADEIIEMKLAANFQGREYPVVHWRTNDTQPEAGVEWGAPLRQADGSWLIVGLGPGDYTLSYRTADGMGTRQLHMSANEEKQMRIPAASADLGGSR